MTGEPGALDRRLSAIVGRHVDVHRVPGVAACVVAGDETVWSIGRGFAELERGTAVDERTAFRIGSITKTLTATAIVQLRDEGGLHLDDPLVAHVPEFAAVRNPWGPIESVTLRRLLTHEAGLPREAPGLDWTASTFPTTDQIVDELGRVELVVAPDARAKYSNLGYQLLGEVIARVTGVSYRAYVRRELLEPLGMYDAGFEGEVGSADRLASGHYPRTFSDTPPVAPARMKGTDAEGGLLASVAGLAPWASLQFRTGGSERGGAQVLAGPSLAEMHRPRRLVDEGWTEAQGLAWYCTRTPSGIVVGHTGGTFGFKSRLVFHPGARLAAIVLANGEGPAGSLAVELLQAAIEESGPHRACEPGLPVAPPDPYRELLGLYAWQDLSEPARVQWREGQLEIVWSPSDVHALDPTDDPLTFVIRDGSEAGEPCAFRRGTDGEIVGLRIARWQLVRLVAAE
ncbi:MAG: serine hydrolase domain-containing protein [Actinomycetota bacterium]